MVLRLFVRRVKYNRVRRMQMHYGDLVMNFPAKQREHGRITIELHGEGTAGK